MARTAVSRLEAEPTAPEPTPYSIASRRLLRETVLDAARGLLEVRVWPEVTMADVARAAGVSRQTLYNEFGSREELGQAFVLREEERLICAVEETIRANRDSPTAALGRAFEVFLTAVDADPLIRRILSEGDPDRMLALVTTQGRPVVDDAVTRLAAIFLASWPRLQRAEAELLSDCLARLGISYATLPATSPTMTATAVATVLGPHIERVLANPMTGTAKAQSAG